jgi:hypothetical protein
MLDDDSCPVDVAFLAALRVQAPDVGAVASEVLLTPPGSDVQGGASSRPRESGGLPEVFIGCGVALRREAFLACGGYDASFGYYAEEYDLAAKLMLAGMRVTLDRRFKVRHEKVGSGRDMNSILRRLVRNNGWVAQRYAPADQRRAELREVLVRYAAIASREQSIPGYTAGAAELLATLHRQDRTPLSGELFERFTGFAEARRSFGEVHAERPFRTARIVDEGKNSRFIRRALMEYGVRIVGDREDAEAVVIGTMSPGPLLDAWERRTATIPARRVISAWKSLTTDAFAATVVVPSPSVEAA